MNGHCRITAHRIHSHLACVRDAAAVSYLDPRPQDVENRFSEEKAFFDSATYAYYQTYLNTPFWGAGLTVTLKQAPVRVLAATNTSEHGIDAVMHSTSAIERYRRLFRPAKGRWPRSTSRSERIQRARRQRL